MRPFQTGDIVRDASLDEILPEWQHNQMIFRVIATAVVTEWAPSPIQIQIGEAWVTQQYLTLEQSDGQPHYMGLAVQEAFTHKGPRFKVLKTVEEVLAEELMA